MTTDKRNNSVKEDESHSKLMDIQFMLENGGQLVKANGILRVPAEKVFPRAETTAYVATTGCDHYVYSRNGFTVPVTLLDKGPVKHIGQMVKIMMPIPEDDKTKIEKIDRLREKGFTGPDFNGTMWGRNTWIKHVSPGVGVVSCYPSAGGDVTEVTVGLQYTSQEKLGEMVGVQIELPSTVKTIEGNPNNRFQISLGQYFTDFDAFNEDDEDEPGDWSDEDDSSDDEAKASRTMNRPSLKIAKESVFGEMPAGEKGVIPQLRIKRSYSVDEWFPSLNSEVVLAETEIKDATPLLIEDEPGKGRASMGSFYPVSYPYVGEEAQERSEPLSVPKFLEGLFVRMREIEPTKAHMAKRKVVIATGATDRTLFKEMRNWTKRDCQLMLLLVYRATARMMTLKEVQSSIGNVQWAIRKDAENACDKMEGLALQLGEKEQRIQKKDRKIESLRRTVQSQREQLSTGRKMLREMREKNKEEKASMYEKLRAEIAEHKSKIEALERQLFQSKKNEREMEQLKEKAEITTNDFRRRYREARIAIATVYKLWFGEDRNTEERSTYQDQFSQPLYSSMEERRHPIESPMVGDQPISPVQVKRFLERMLKEYGGE